MGSSMIRMGIIIALGTMLWTGTSAQSGCTNVLLSMAPCLNYVTGSSSSPSSSCCSQLASVVKSQPHCLCSALSGGGSSLGININQTLALEMPKACNVQTPPVSQCNVGVAANGPVASPVGSPEDAPEDSSNEAPASQTSSSASDPTTSPLASDPTTSSSVSGSKASPSNGMSSDGSSVKMPLMFITLLLLMASYASVSSSF